VKNYISGLLNVPTGVKDLADLIAFNSAHAAEELPAPFYTDQSEYAVINSDFTLLFSYTAQVH
jgi:amidase